MKRLLFRVWYYFRIGYHTYLALPIAVFSYMTIIYQLLLSKISFLEPLFPSFTIFMLIGLTALFPTAIAFGYMHIKRTSAYKSEIEIGVEANPFFYITTPGKEKLISIPMAIESLKLSIDIADKLGILTPERKATFQKLIAQNERLLKGERIE